MHCSFTQRIATVILLNSHGILSVGNSHRLNNIIAKLFNHITPNLLAITGPKCVMEKIEAVHFVYTWPQCSVSVAGRDYLLCSACFTHQIMLGFSSLCSALYTWPFTANGERGLLKSLGHSSDLWGGSLLQSAQELWIPLFSLFRFKSPHLISLFGGQSVWIFWG